MKICIYGAGAIGGYMGVMLSDSEADVSLIACGAHLDAIQKDRLKVVFKDGTHKHQRMTATDNLADLGPQGRFLSTRLSRPEVESAAA